MWHYVGPNYLWTSRSVLNEEGTEIMKSLLIDRLWRFTRYLVLQFSALEPSPASKVLCICVMNTVWEYCMVSHQHVGCFSLRTIGIGNGQWACLDQFLQSVLMNDLCTCFIEALLHYTSYIWLWGEGGTLNLFLVEVKSSGCCYGYGGNGSSTALVA
jgi:hypothetical protein